MATQAENISPTETKDPENQVGHLFESLLPFRILAHATLALLYVPMVVAYISIDFDPENFVGLLAFVILGILGFMDFLVLSRKVNTVSFAVVDALLILVLPLCLWTTAVDGFQFATNFDHYNAGDDTLDVEYGVITLMPVILSLLYVIIAGVVAFYHKKRGIHSLLYTPATVAGDGSSRSHRDGMVKHCSYFLFQHSYFRKHSFEPAGLAIFRGSMAVLACVGLLLFSIYSGFNQQELYDNSSRSITETSIQEYALVPDAGVSFIPNSPTLSVTVSTLDGSQISTDFSVQQISGGAAGALLQMNTNSTADSVQVWYCLPDTDNCRYFPFNSSELGSTTGTGFNVSWSGETDMVLWSTVAPGIAWINSTQVNYTEPLILSANTQYNVLLTIVGYQYGKLNWLSFDSQILSAVATTTGTSALFTFRPYQNIVVQQNFSSQSIFVLIGNILSKVGGIFAFIDGVYAIIFGRTILAIVTGSRPISPFGLIGIVAHDTVQDLINKQFPKLQRDIDGPIEERGMAAYVSEVAIDTGYIRSNRAAKAADSGDSRRRNRVSDGSQAQSRLSTEKEEV